MRKKLLYLDQHLKKTPTALAIAVSGGADSMALALLCQEWANGKKMKLTALIVDHGVRAESAKEAKRVQAWLQKRRINAVILKGQGLTAGPGLQSRAREYRYQLLLGWCREHKVTHLLLAHHADDQRETILMRLVRGSGVDGLAGMSPAGERDGITLVRPLLGVSKKELMDYLSSKKQEWIEDPANQDPKHTRNRLRKLNSLLEEEGLTPERLMLIHSNLSRSADYLNTQADGFLAHHATLCDWGYAAFDRAEFQVLHEEMQLRSLKKMLCFVNGGAPEVRFEELLRLAQALKHRQFKGATLGHVELVPSSKQGRIFVIKEHGRIRSAMAARGSEATFDGRYRFQLSGRLPHKSYIIAPLGKHYAKLPAALLKKHQHLPKKVFSVLPALFHLEELCCQPHIGWSAEKAVKPVSVTYLPLEKR